MKKILLLLFTIGFLQSVGSQTYTWNPQFFNADQSASLTVSNFDPNSEWGVSEIYLWAWHFQEDGSQINNPDATGDNFSNSPVTARFTNNGDGTYTYDFGIIQDFFNDTDVARIGFLLKSQNGGQQTGDNFKDVGDFQVVLVSPEENSTTILSSGASLSVSASNSNGSADYVLKANSVVINTQNDISNYVFNVSNILENTSYDLEVTQNATTITKSFTALIDPNTEEESLPSGLKSGINYSRLDDTKVTLVVDAPLKDFVYVAGSFNNWAPGSNDAMKKDPSSDKFWIEITGLTPGQTETYQYWVVDSDPIAGSPELVKTADPFSTLVLSPFDDPDIPDSSFPDLPDYPDGQEREVTVIETGQTPYNWQVTNFVKPKIEDLIVYEVLVRDFDANRSYQDLIDRIDYFKNLNINAIHLMPVMEFEGNESWGYNTAFHMALDKFYGTPDKLKEFIDLCHQNGIAIILDLVLNHAYGRNPMVRMWMDDPEGDGWGEPASNSPYLNEEPRHAYNVGSDFNHQEPLTQEYTRRVIEHWITEFKIDGFRWDLTKGFTQNCSGSDEGCTNAYQQDRIDVLKEYADYSWSLDDTHYVIFEHLGSDNEEQQWANYRAEEGKGIMMWGKMTEPYSQLTRGNNGDKSITRMGHEDRGFDEPRLLGYPESHDEERLMYFNVSDGNSSNSNHNVKDLNTALSRMSALGAVSVMVPGPKMIWHFGDLGMDNSIFTCSDGSFNNDGCKLDTKPQPQWEENWLSDAFRRQIYDDWARMHELKINESVFEGDYVITSGTSNFTPRIDIFDITIPSDELRNVIIYSNFSVNTQVVATNFPNGVTDTWYDLMDPTGNTTVSNSMTSLTIPAGQFRILGNVPSEALSIDNNNLDSVRLFPNPARDSFRINAIVTEVEVYNLSGKRVKHYKGNFDQNEEFIVSDLSSGVYMLRAINSNGQKMTSKLVKL